MLDVSGARTFLVGNVDEAGSALSSTLSSYGELDAKRKTVFQTQSSHPNHSHTIPIALVPQQILKASNLPRLHRARVHEICQKAVEQLCAGKKSSLHQLDE